MYSPAVSRGGIAHAYLVSLQYKIFHLAVFHAQFGGYGAEQVLMAGVHGGSLGLSLFFQFLLQETDEALKLRMLHAIVQCTNLFLF